MCSIKLLSLTNVFLLVVLQETNVFTCCTLFPGQRRAGGPRPPRAASAQDRGQAVCQRAVPRPAAQAGQHRGRRAGAGEGETAEVSLYTSKQLRSVYTRQNS